MRIWTRLGVSLVILAAFGFFAYKGLKSSHFLQARQKQIAMTLAGAGVLLWLVQKVHHKPVEVDADEAQQYISPFYATGSYWGVILLLCGTMVGGSTRIEQTLGSGNLKARFAALENLVRLPKFASARAAKTNPVPDLKLQGIGFSPNPAKSSVIINGQTLMCGESGQGVKVLSINAGSVTVETAGQVTVLTLR